MAQYTDEFLATARQGYESTDQPMRELARELGIGITTLSTLSEKHGWAKRSLRQRGLSPAMQLLAEVNALAANGPHPSRLATLAPQDDGATPTPTLPLSGGGSPSAVEPAPNQADLLIKLEQILAQLIAAQQLAPANGIQSPQGARNLTLLIQSLRALQGMRGAASTDTGPIDDDDDMPRDIDEFRLDLARRIDAFVASRTDAGDGVENSPPAPLEADE
ncbi:MAG: hypothetical protein Q8M24_04505 [Pseudolabrys sp.]|nr:hypothetical protein [Pseudolabrys sp.]MDP2294707.1 hypothetical protein [Pseudolabrys sp.]